MSEKTDNHRKQKINVETEKAKEPKVLKINLDADNAENSRAKMKNHGRRKKKLAKYKKTMFLSTVDPYDRPLKWWEKEPVKYAKSEVEFFAEDLDNWVNHISNTVKMKAAQGITEANTLHRRDSMDEDFMEFGDFFKSSCSHPPVRRRLEMLMGSNVVRLTDRKYMIKLMSKIKENHEKQQRVRIEERKKQELLRTKNMILNRFIPVREAPEEIRQYPLFKLFLYCDDLLEKKQKKKARRKLRLSKSVYNLLYPDNEADGDEGDEEEEIYMKKIYNGNKEELVPLSPEEIEKFLLEREAKQDIEDGFMLSQEDYDRLHYETQAVKSLRDTKTVEEMYSKAYEIIGILHSHVDKELLKKKERQEEDDEKGKEDNEENKDQATIEGN